MATGDKKRALMADDINDAVGGYGVIGMDKKGAANGVAELGNDGKVPSSQLPATSVPSPYTSTPEMDGTGSAGSSADYARGDHVHPSDTGKLGTGGDGSNVTAAFTAASSRTNIATGEKLSVIFGKIAKWFADLGTAAFRAATSSVTQSSTDLIESGAVYTGLAAKYEKPSGGIPASDLASGVIPTVPSAYTSNPEMDGTASPGSSGSWAKGDHVHPSDTTKADKTGLTDIFTTGSTNNSGGAIGAGVFFHKDGTLVQAKTAIASGATLTLNTNYEVPTAGALNALKSAMNFLPVSGNAGFHNSIYRGKYLGSSVTAEQYSAISAGTFDDLYIGDYWTIGGVNWRIAAFDYWLNTGDTNCTTHHVVIVPDGTLGNAKMNNSNTTTGGYVGSDIYTGNNDNTGLSGAKTTINSAFGSAHILSHRELLTNAVTDGKASGWAWYDSTVELMNECMVYGHHAWASALGYETGIDKGQLPLFAHDHSRICNRSHWWLRDVYSAASFVYVDNRGHAAYAGASYSYGVRPAFAIKA